MFKWYQLSEKCYAFLEDVDPELWDHNLFSRHKMASLQFSGLSLDNIPRNQHVLSKARWFTRGWTLQELIAPEEVFFYVKGWRYIGTKSAMAPMLAGITGISESALLGGNLGRVSVAKRMSWMSRRKTTRIEDVAYSLLGIFGINMPLLYGEGGRAFVRLQEEIMKDNDDHSLFAWTPSISERVRGLNPRSVFACRPREFEASGSIYSSPFEQGIGEPYALTNKGVRVQLQVLPYSPRGRTETNLFLAILECRYANPDLQGYRPAIVVQQLSPRGTQFCRSSNIEIVPVHDEEAREAVMETFFLCKTVPAWYFAESSSGATMGGSQGSIGG